MKTRFNIIFLIVLAASIISCAPTKRFIVTTEPNKERITQATHIGVVNDVCLQLDPFLKRNYIMKEESKRAENYMLEGAKKCMEQKGYDVDFYFSPFIGAYKLSDQTFRVAEKRGDKVKAIYPPFFVDESLSIDDEYKKALDDVITQVLYTVADKKKNQFPADENMKKNIGVIKDRTGLDMILVIDGNGSIVPTGKSIAQGVTLGIITTVLTFGMITFYAYNVSYLDTYAAIIDLNNGEMLWSNSLRIKQRKPTKQKFYSKAWPKYVFYHFPEKNSSL